MAKDTFYFSHDYNARNDEKVKRLIRKHKFCGYGIFWGIIEDLYNNSNELTTDFEGIADDYKTTPDIIESIVTEFDLFKINDGYFGSESVERRLQERDLKSRKAKESAKRRWNKTADNEQVNANALRNNTGALPTESEGNAIKERKGKEINEIKRAKALVVSPETPQVTKKEYLEIVNQFTGKEKKEVVEALKAFIQKRPEFLEPYADYWNIAVQGCNIPQVKSLSESRIKKLKTRIQEEAFDFCEIIKKIRGSTKLKTESNWFSFDWVFDNQTNYVKIIEGNYDN